MSSRAARFLFALIPAALFALPLIASAHSIPYFGPVIESSWNRCPLGWGALINVINNLITIGISIAIVFVAPLSFAYAGFLMVLNPTSLGSIEKGKSILLNTIIGIVVALSAWLIVDAVMAALYDPSAVGATWNSLITSAGINPCIKQASSLESLNQSAGQTGSGGLQVTGVGANGTVSAVGADGTSFTFQTADIAAQLPAASPALKSLVGCIEAHVPAGVGLISDLTDTYVVTDSTKIAHCAAVGREGDSSCKHTANSCHYGGRSCVGSSYAVDYGDEQNADVLKAAAAKCGGASWNFEGDHLHLSVGAQNGCACDTGLPKVGS